MLFASNLFWLETHLKNPVFNLSKNMSNVTIVLQLSTSLIKDYPHKVYQNRYYVLWNGMLHVLLAMIPSWLMFIIKQPIHIHVNLNHVNNISVIQCVIIVHHEAGVCELEPSFSPLLTLSWVVCIQQWLYSDISYVTK